MNNSNNLEKPDYLQELSQSELIKTGGGGFWYDVLYIAGTTLHFIAYAIVDAHNNPIRPSEYK